jgi:hypothetical protein
VIKVERAGEGDPLEFEVIVRVGNGETRYHVTMARDTCERLTMGTRRHGRDLVYNIQQQPDISVTILVGDENGMCRSVVGEGP